MIRCIVAMDSKRGVADDQKYQGQHGFAWIGKLPTDTAYFKQKTLGSNILMGYGEYLAHGKQPLPGRTNIVATTKPERLAPGFKKVNDAREFLQNTHEDIWITGGAGLYASTLDLVDELYITRIQKDFHCTKFFPEFTSMFTLVSESDPIIENNITYTLQVWKSN